MLWLLLCYQAAEMLLLSCLYQEKLIDTACSVLFEEMLPSVHFGGVHSREFFPVFILSSFQVLSGVTLAKKQNTGKAISSTARIISA
jgi:hypothetical protein